MLGMGFYVFVGRLICKSLQATILWAGLMRSASFPSHRPSCLETGELIDMEHNIVYKAFSAGQAELIALEKALKGCNSIYMQCGRTWMAISLDKKWKGQADMLAAGLFEGWMEYPDVSNVSILNINPFWATFMDMVP
ncbi:uncharacterized protein LOC111009646 isoform X2 [Momordica charantia]|uniref:Uncharacterized protein LOC111009646 isoform X2 n=1 Tax=Momordica charantia TaxID=3673 RepID=A0A6J1CB80_MOMCH|nr:uncharacterized protein LOC111009646 isoform X2 [Momordica charantia]